MVYFKIEVQVGKFQVKDIDFVHSVRTHEDWFLPFHFN